MKQVKTLTKNSTTYQRKYRQLCHNDVIRKKNTKKTNARFIHMINNEMKTRASENKLMCVIRCCCCAQRNMKSTEGRKEHLVGRKKDTYVYINKYLILFVSEICLKEKIVYTLGFWRCCCCCCCRRHRHRRHSLPPTCTTT